MDAVGVGCVSITSTGSLCTGSREQHFAAGSLPPALALLASLCEGFQPYSELMTDVWQEVPLPSSPERSRFSLSSAFVTFVITYLYLHNDEASYLCQVCC